MAESVYNVIEIIGTSTESWAKAGKAAVERASKTLKIATCEPFTAAKRSGLLMVLTAPHLGTFPGPNTLLQVLTVSGVGTFGGLALKIANFP